MSALQKLHNIIGKDEQILWSGKPQLKALILETIFQPLFPIALLWGLLTTLGCSGYIFLFAKCLSIYNIAQCLTNEGSGFFLGVLLFYITLTTPLWIYLGRILSLPFKYKNAAFLVTDKGVYISRGVFSFTFIHKPFMEIAHINLHRGIIDNILDVGDVILGENLFIYNISNYLHVYNLVKQLQQDIYSDVQYPNDLRFPKNRGYNSTNIPFEEIK